MSKKPKADEDFSAGAYQVGLRLFASRISAEAYCRAERISLYSIWPVPFPKVDPEVLKLSVRDDWTLRVVFEGDAALVIFSHASKTQAFTCPLSALVDLASTVRARSRELARVERGS